MVQWVPYGQTLDEFLAHVRTFLRCSRTCSVIAGAGGYGFYMIGSDGPVDFDPAAIEAVLERPGVLDDVNSRARLAPAHGRRLGADDPRPHVGDAATSSATAVGDGPLITDDRPLPEYFILRRLANPDAPLLSLGGLRALLPYARPLRPRNRFRHPVLCSDRCPPRRWPATLRVRRPSVTVVAGGQPPHPAGGPACVRHDRSRHLGHAPRREPVGDALLALGLPSGLVGWLRRERPRGDARRRPGRRARRRHADRDHPAHAPPRGGAG